MLAAQQPSSKLDITGEITPAFAEILTPEALAFVEALAERFMTTRDALLAERVV